MAGIPGILVALVPWGAQVITVTGSFSPESCQDAGEGAAAREQRRDDRRAHHRRSDRDRGSGGEGARGGSVAVRSCSRTLPSRQERLSDVRATDGDVGVNSGGPLEIISAERTIEYCARFGELFPSRPPLHHHGRHATQRHAVVALAQQCALRAAHALRPRLPAGDLAGRPARLRRRHRRRLPARRGHLARQLVRRQIRRHDLPGRPGGGPGRCRRAAGAADHAPGRRGRPGGRLHAAPGLAGGRTGGP